MKKENRKISNKFPMSGKVILFMAGVILLGCSISVFGREEAGQTREYQAAEKEYRSELRDFLNQAGYRNSGINMTRTISCQKNTGNREEVTKSQEEAAKNREEITKDPEKEAADGEPDVGMREYTVLIYHKKIGKLNREETAKLMTDIVNITVPMDDCTVSYKFME